LGFGKKTLIDWVKRYRELGGEGLRSRYSGSRSAKIPPAVKHKITELKRKYPSFGVKRIAQVLRRVFFLKASRETVRRTLHQQNLILKEKRKARRSPPKPRFFERSTPNQMWQSDIFTFRLGGKNAYLIGFMDDYSRYLVGCDLFRSQSAEHVLEVYRTAVGEYGVPKEVLTDQGRQYTNWRGKTRFELELQKDRVHHIKSRAHHPMTLGKVERFWKTIWEDFLVRAQFESFESARERVRLWVKHYNHRRPHQGIGGLCPADRFFEIQKELREIMEKGISENLEALALRGEPKEPFYMVGRMGDESVVIRAEKGKLRLRIDRETDGEDREMVSEYDKEGEKDESYREQGQKAIDPVQCRAEVPGRIVGLEREEKGDSGMQGIGDPRDAAHPLAAAGDGGDAEGFGAQEPQRPATAGLRAEVTEASDAQSAQARGQDSQARAQVGEDSATDQADREVGLGEGRVHDETGRDLSALEGRADCGGEKWSDERQRGSQETGGITQDVLQVGEPGAQGDGGGFGLSSERETGATDRPGEAGAQGTEGGVGEKAQGGGRDSEAPSETFSLKSSESS
jgi:transposase InsO family protein